MFDTAYFFDTFSRLLPGVPLTFFLALFSFVVGGAFGFLLSLIRLYQVRFLSNAVVAYVSFFRGTPLLVQLFMFYYGIPIFLKSLGFQFNFALIDAIYYALVIYSLHASAYLADIFRSALSAVDKGQKEAALSVGMSNFQTLRRIILPQAFMITLPNLLNFFIIQIKNTALASIITVADLMGLADIESGRTSKFLEVYFMAALMYWAMCLFLEFVFSFVEKKLAKYRKAYNA